MKKHQVVVSAVILGIIMGLAGRLTHKDIAWAAEMATLSTVLIGVWRVVDLLKQIKEKL